jgi:cyclase
MKYARVIPVLLLFNNGIVKTIKYKNPTYIGDPINSVRIFNEKEVDEIILLDINATPNGRGPNFSLIEEIASEAFMPLGYGGGVQTIQQIERLFKIGIEKVIMNTGIHNSRLLREASDIFGSQSIVASIDVKKDLFGVYRIYSNCGKKKETEDLISCISRVQEEGAGEIILNSIDRDGTMSGYDLNLISSISNKLIVPLVALGGAGCLEHLQNALKAGASSVAAGSMFVFHGPHKAVLISYISPSQITSSIYT